MSLGLHPKCIKQLEESLAEILRHLKVTNGIHPDISSIIPLIENEVLPKTGKFYEQLQKYIGEFPLFNFVYKTLSRELAEIGTFSPELNEKPLSEFTNYTNINDVAVRLVEEFESLPWSYIVSFELPDSIGRQLRLVAIPYSLTSSLKIIAPDDTYNSLYPLQQENKELNNLRPGNEEHMKRFTEELLRAQRGIPIHWNTETSYIQIDVEGFIGNYGKTAPLERALETLKSFVGLSLATRLMKVNDNQATQSFSWPPKSHLIIHRKIDHKWEVYTTHELPSDLTGTLHGLEIESIDGKLESDLVSGFIQNKLQKIATAFSNPDKAEHVLLAAQWLLDSYVGTNELLSFVQTMIAMEIILGEESKPDVVGIGELLRNRCAYLIGESHSQRKMILTDFDKIYNVRSKIVHRGKSRLSSKERILFQELQWMCRRVISEELELIEQDKGKSNNVKLISSKRKR